MLQEREWMNEWMDPSMLLSESNRYKERDGRYFPTWMKQDLIQMSFVKGLYYCWHIFVKLQGKEKARDMDWCKWGEAKPVFDLVLPFDHSFLWDVLSFFVRNFIFGGGDAGASEAAGGTQLWGVGIRPFVGKAGDVQNSMKKKRK